MQYPPHCCEGTLDNYCAEVEDLRRRGYRVTGSRKIARQYGKGTMYRGGARRGKAKMPKDSPPGTARPPEPVPACSLQELPPRGPVGAVGMVSLPPALVALAGTDSWQLLPWLQRWPLATGGHTTHAIFPTPAAGRSSMLLVSPFAS